MFPKQGSLQFIGDKTNIFGTISCHLLSFEKEFETSGMHAERDVKTNTMFKY